MTAAAIARESHGVDAGDQDLPCAALLPEKKRAGWLRRCLVRITGKDKDKGKGKCKGKHAGSAYELGSSASAPDLLADPALLLAPVAAWTDPSKECEELRQAAREAVHGDGARNEDRDSAEPTLPSKASLNASRQGQELALALAASSGTGADAGAEERRRAELESAMFMPMPGSSSRGPAGTTTPTPGSGQARASGSGSAGWDDPPVPLPRPSAPRDIPAWEAREGKEPIPLELLDEEDLRQQQLEVDVEGLLPPLPLPQPRAAGFAGHSHSHGFSKPSSSVSASAPAFDEDDEAEAETQVRIRPRSFRAEPRQVRFAHGADETQSLAQTPAFARETGRSWGPGAADELLRQGSPQQWDRRRGELQSPEQPRRPAHRQGQWQTQGRRPGSGPASGSGSRSGSGPGRGPHENHRDNDSDGDDGDHHDGGQRLGQGLGRGHTPPPYLPPPPLPLILSPAREKGLDGWSQGPGRAGLASPSASTSASVAASPSPLALGPGQGQAQSRRQGQGQGQGQKAAFSELAKAFAGLDGFD